MSGSIQEVQINNEKGKKETNNKKETKNSKHINNTEISIEKKFDKPVKHSYYHYTQSLQ